MELELNHIMAELVRVMGDVKISGSRLCRPPEVLDICDSFLPEVKDAAVEVGNELLDMGSFSEDEQNLIIVKHAEYLLRFWDSEQDKYRTIDYMAILAQTAAKALDAFRSTDGIASVDVVTELDIYGLGLIDDGRLILDDAFATEDGSLFVVIESGQGRLVIAGYGNRSGTTIELSVELPVEVAWWLWSGIQYLGRDDSC